SGILRSALTDLIFFRNHIKINPVSVFSGNHTFRTQNDTVILVLGKLFQDFLHLFTVKALHRFLAPACEDLVRMMMVVMAAATLTVMVMMMLMIVIMAALAVVVVMMMLMIVIMAALAVMVVMMMLMVVIMAALAVMVVMMLMVMAALTVMVMVLMVMLILYFIQADDRAFHRIQDFLSSQLLHRS